MKEKSKKNDCFKHFGGQPTDIQRKYFCKQTFGNLTALFNLLTQILKIVSASTRVKFQSRSQKYSRIVRNVIFLAGLEMLKLLNQPHVYTLQGSGKLDATDDSSVPTTHLPKDAIMVKLQNLLS